MNYLTHSTGIKRFVEESLCVASMGMLMLRGGKVEQGLVALG